MPYSRLHSSLGLSKDQLQQTIAMTAVISIRDNLNLDPLCCPRTAVGYPGGFDCSIRAKEGIENTNLDVDDCHRKRHLMEDIPTIYPGGQGSRRSAAIVHTSWSSPNEHEVCVCVILYFYPATCGPKGHGSGSAAALEHRQ